MADEDVAWYRRLLEARPELADIACWTVIQPLTEPVTVPEVARRLGGDPSEIEDHTGWDFGEPNRMVHLHQAGTAVVTFEVTDAQGVRGEVLRWLSDGAAVHSSWWCEAVGRSLLCYAAFGRVLTELQDLDDRDPAGDQPTALDEDRAALRDDVDHPAQLAFVERRTGIRLDPTWLDQPHPAVVLGTPIPDDPRPPGMFGSADPDLTAVFLLAGESTQRAALRWVLDLLADESDLRGEGAVCAVLDALPGDWPDGEDLSRQLNALRSRLTEQMNASPGGSPERWRRYYRMRAGQAFTAMVTSSPGQRYPPDTLWYAQQALQRQWPAIRAELWRRARSARR